MSPRIRTVKNVNMLIVSPGFNSVDADDDISVEDGTDLMEDVLTIMYSFAARMYGRRRARTGTLSSVQVLAVTP